jgi:trehalose-6-phosphate synthase
VPALHSRVDLIRVTADHYASYREVNAFMARTLLRFGKPDSLFWIHDYHFLPLATECVGSESNVRSDSFCTRRGRSAAA